MSRMMCFSIISQDKVNNFINGVVEVSLIVSKGIRFQVIIFEDLLSPDAELFRVFSNPILTVPFKEKHIPFQRRFSGIFSSQDARLI